MRRRTFMVAVPSGVAAVLLASCTAHVDGSASAGSAPRLWTVAGALAQLPATGLDGNDRATVTVGDIDRATDLAERKRPGSDADPVRITAWAFQITSTSNGRVAVVLPEVVAPNFLDQSDAFADEVGWNLGSVESFAEINAATNTFSVLTGDFDAAELTVAMGQPVDQVWRIGPEQDGAAEGTDRTVARPLGQSLRTGLRGNSIAVSRYTAPIADWISGAPGLDADPVLGELAQALDREQVYGAVLVPKADFLIGEPEDGPPLLDPFEAMAVGFVKVDDAAVGVFTYYFADEVTATANVKRLETLVTDGRSQVNSQPLSDRFVVREVSVTGHVLTGTFGLINNTIPDIGWGLIRTRDVLAVHS